MYLIINTWIIFGICTYTIFASCGEPENIPNASNNATNSGTYAENVTISYDCNDGYRNYGYRHYTCFNGTWSYGTLACNQIFCSDVQIPKNGRRVGNYERAVGTWAEFECKPGYIMVGNSLMLCRANGEWRPQSPPTCEPKSCGDFGNVEHGDTFQPNLEGQYDIFGNVIHITCDDGYILWGNSQVTCTENGQWDSRPTCKKTSCPQHPGLNSSCISESSLSSEGSTLTFLCEENTENISVTEVGMGTVFCYRGEWDDLITACYCDCKIDTELGSFSTNGLGNGFLKHGGTLQWSCNSGYIKNTQEAIRCDDGELNIQPFCLLLEELTTLKLPSTESDIVLTEDPSIAITTYSDSLGNVTDSGEMTSDVEESEREITKPDDEISTFTENVERSTEGTVQSMSTSSSNKNLNIKTSRKYKDTSDTPGDLHIEVKTDRQNTAPNSSSSAVFNTRTIWIFVVFFVLVIMLKL